MNTTRTTRPRHKVTALLGAATLLTAVGTACADSDPAGPSGTARIQILLTDAPSDMLDSAHVWISRVYLVGGGGDPDTAATDTVTTGGKIDLFHNPSAPLVFDLLTLRDGVTADVTGEVPVEATTYRGLRFVVDSARVTLSEGFSFEDGSRVGSMKVPSGAQSGIKVKLDDVLDPDTDERLILTVDLDVDENFVIQMNNQTGTVRRILFTPVLKEKERTER
ncbi:MAG: DUF4382 domain-containing protein [Longimicrobiales bacterium]